jgi:tRNA threonylcarbamoyladenosine modification (KEOPS) complex Cgi121 subunit
MELVFAFGLARRAFDGRNNISRKLSNEALLFLARETNFASALRKIGASSPRSFALVCEKSLPLARVKKALALTSAKKLALSKMGKKKGAYFEGELAAEGMALARVRN